MDRIVTKAIFKFLARNDDIKNLVRIQTNNFNKTNIKHNSKLWK